jgi:hypothetical protein
MRKFTIVLLIILSFFSLEKISCQDSLLFSNVDFTFQDKKIQISYDLKSTNKDEIFNINFACYNSKNEVIYANSITGDVGKVKQGLNKQIFWDIRNDVTGLDEEIKIELIASKEVKIKKGKHLLKSTLLPGLGDYKARNGKHHFLYGLFSYGFLGGAIAMNHYADLMYKKYKTEFEIDQSRKQFNEAVLYKNLSVISASASVLIWTADLAFLNFRINKVKKDISKSKYYSSYSNKKISFKTALKKITTKFDYEIEIEKGEQLLSEENLPEALNKFQKAKDLKKIDTETIDQKIEEISLKIDNNKKIEQEYQTYILNGTKFLNENKLLEAKEEFKKASILKPKEIYPKNMLQEIEYFEKEKEKKLKFNSIIDTATIYLKQKKLQESKVYFEKALEIIPFDSLTNTKITYIDNELFKLREIENTKKINLIIKEADILIKNKKHQAAIDKLNTAFEIVGANTQVSQKIKFCENELEKNKELTEKNKRENIYKSKVGKIDELIRAKKYEMAINKIREILYDFEEYDQILLQKLTFCENQTSKAEEIEIDREYKKLISLGDKAWNNKSYGEAKIYYEDALKIKPNESHPKIRLQVIEDQEKSNKNNIKNNLVDLYKKCKKSVFIIKTSESQGSGFLISTDGIAVSNYHVFENTDFKLTEITTDDGQKFKIEKIIESFPQDDYIIFKVKNYNISLTPVILANKELEVGEQVFAIGNPEGFTQTLSNGIVSGYRVVKEVNYIQTTTPITHGSSGGPLFNMFGEVVGITTTLLNDPNSPVFGLDGSVIGISDKGGEGSLFGAINILNLSLNKYK